jgi:hypothetical protein
LGATSPEIQLELNRQIYSMLPRARNDTDPQVIKIIIEILGQLGERKGILNPVQGIAVFHEGSINEVLEAA